MNPHNGLQRSLKKAVNFSTANSNLKTKLLGKDRD